MINGYSQLDDGILRKILTFLNVVELCVLCRVCKRWQNMIEKDPLIFQDVNLEILPSNIQVLNLLKIFSRDKHIRMLHLPKNASASDTSYLLMCLPETLSILQVCNINMEFSKVFTRRFEFLQTLILNNVTNRKRLFDETELKALVLMGSNATELVLDNTPIDDGTLTFLLQKFKNLKILSLLNASQLGNHTLHAMSKNCHKLTHFTIGGSPTKYNLNLTREGFQLLTNSDMPLQELNIHYVAKVGDNVLKLVAQKFNKTIRKIQVTRNCFEKCSKLSDKGLSYLKQCEQLTHLTLAYSRKFRETINIQLSNLHQLQYLCLKHCPVLQDLSVLTLGCPNLQEVDFSGDSWVSKEALYGLAKHPRLIILHLGHFEHGDQNCDQQLQDFPPDGMFIEGLFKQKNTFPLLSLLYLQANCNLTYWLDVRLVKIRQRMFVKYTKDDFLMNQK